MLVSVLSLSKKTLVAGSLLLLVACSGGNETARTARTGPVSDPAQSTSASTDATPSVSSASTPDTLAVRTSWTYENKVEGVDEPITHRAFLTSPTPLTLGFPYTGGSRVTLGLRERAGESVVSLQVKNGAFNQSFQGGSVGIRFDGGPAVQYTYSAAANGSATIIFLDDTNTLLQKLKTARTTLINIEFPNQSHRQLTFRTAGLRWPW